MSRASTLFFALLAPVWFGVFPYNFGLNNPNENARLYTTLALVEHHTPRLDDEVARFGPINDVALLNGHRYAAKAPGVTLAGVPVYWLVWKLAPRLVPFDDGRAWLTMTTLLLRLVVVQLPCFLFLVWLYRWLRRREIDEALALMATAALALGTNYLAYAQMFCSHSLAAATAFLAFAFILDGRRPLVAGLLAGAVTLLDYQGAVTSLALALCALDGYRDTKRRLLFGGGALACVLVLLAWQRAAFGSAWRLPFHYMEDEHLRGHMAHGFFGFGVPRLAALRALVFDRTVGLWGTSPFAILALAGVIAGRRQRAVWMAGAIVAAMIVAVSGITNWRAGWSVGPRYLVTAMPFVVFAAAQGLDGIEPRALVRGVAGGLVAASAITVGVLSILFNTLPYDVTDPLLQVTLPFLRAGFVPHHAGELLGWTSPTFFYFVVAALLAAALVAALAAPRDRAWRWPVALAALMLGLLPSLAWRPRGCPDGVRRMTEIWEPAGRDRIGVLRVAAHADPCRWRDVAALERAICWPGAADDLMLAAGCGH
jgi:hypothetical protein